MSQIEHPVWAVYDRLRSASLSVKYYSCRLHDVEKTNFWIEVVLLCTAPSSAIASLWVWTTPAGQDLWKLLAIPAAIAVVLKPVLGLTKKIKDYEGVLSGYRILEFDLRELRIAIETKQKYDAALQSDFRRIQQRERILVGKNPESKEDAVTKKRCQSEVNQEYPIESFFIPKE